MRIDFTQPNDPATRAKAWAASMVLVFFAVAAVVIGWALTVQLLVPTMGVAAFVPLALLAGVLSYGVGRVIDWLVRS